MLHDITFKNMYYECLIVILPALFFFQPGIRIKVQNRIQKKKKKVTWIQMLMDLGSLLKEMHLTS